MKDEKVLGKMDIYIGVKKVFAEPMIQGDVEGYRIIHPDGYECFYPKHLFEHMYVRFKDGLHLDPEDFESLNDFLGELSDSEAFHIGVALLKWVNR